MKSTTQDLINHIQKSRRTLFILCGLPYSGKTYLAQQIIAATGCSYVSIDDFFHKGGYDWTTNTLPDAGGWDAIFTASYDATKEALGANNNVLYDSTNHTRASRDKLRVVAQELGAETAVIFVDVPTETVWSRWEANSKNKSRPVVDSKLVQMTIDSFEKPTKNEGNIYRPPRSV
jgi:predicted kinase